MECQILFSRKNKKTIISLSSVEFALSMVSANNSQWPTIVNNCLYQMISFPTAASYTMLSYSTECGSSDDLSQRLRDLLLAIATKQNN